MLPALPMPELKPLIPSAQDIPTEPAPSSKSFSLPPAPVPSLYAQLQKGALDCASGSPFPSFPYKSSSNMLQDPTCWRLFPAACSPDIKPQQQGNEDPCREKETVRGWKWQRRDSEGSEEQERDSESLEGQGRLREAGQDPRRSGAGAVPGVTVPSRGTRHRDSTRTCGETPNPSGDSQPIGRPAQGCAWPRAEQGTCSAPRSPLKGDPSPVPPLLSSPGMTMSPSPSMAKLSASSPFSSRS